MLNLNTLKEDIFEEHNRIRQNPKSFIPILEKHLGYFKEGNVLYKPNDPVGIMTQEGPEVYKECIKFLKNQKTLKELKLNDCLCKAAQDHVNDIGPKGITDHIGSDGSEPSDRIERYLNWDITIAENLDFGGKTGEDVIVSLIVDDGVPNRGHRMNIFKDDLKYIGIGIGRHNSEYEICTTLAYVGEISDEKYKTINEKLDTIRVAKKKAKTEEAPTEDKGGKSKTKTPKDQKNKKKDKKEKLENFFGPIQIPYDLESDPDKPKGAVDCKMVTASKKANGVLIKNIRKVYTMKDRSQITLDIEEINE